MKKIIFLLLPLLILLSCKKENVINQPQEEITQVASKQTNDIVVNLTYNPNTLLLTAEAIAKSNNITGKNGITSILIYNGESFTTAYYSWGITGSKYLLQMNKGAETDLKNKVFQPGRYFFKAFYQLPGQIPIESYNVIVTIL